MKIFEFEDTQSVLEDKLTMLAEIAADRPTVCITFFRSDEKKDGGSYAAATGVIKKIDDYERVIVLTDSTRIPIRDVLKIESELFEGFD